MPDGPVAKPAESVQPTNAPTSKVMAATSGSAVAAAIAVLINHLITVAGAAPSPEVQAAVATLITAALTFWAGWAVPHSPGERVVLMDDGSVRSAGLVAVHPAKDQDQAVPLRGAPLAR